MTDCRKVKIDREIEAQICSAARALRRDGVAWDEVARRLGVGTEWLKRRIVPGFREKSNKRVADRKLSYIPLKRHPETRPMTDAQLKAFRSLNVQDTRDLVGRLMGDPIPDDPRRSACLMD